MLKNVITVASQDLEEFEQYLYERENARATIRKYMTDIRTFCRYLGKEKEADKNRLLLYKEWLLEHYAISSANSMLAALNQFLKFKGYDYMTVKRIKTQRSLFRQEEKELDALLGALRYDVPRGETCCQLGWYFLERSRYAQAAFWYEQALRARKDPASGAFIEEDCYGFLPAISLCVCHDRMGDLEQARRYNELAGRYKPESEYVVRNREYFEKIGVRG